MKISRVKQNVKLDLKTDVVPLIVGKTGIGKSEMMAQICSELGYILVDLRMGECGEAADLFGLPTIYTDEHGVKRTAWTLPTWYPKKEDEAKPHMIFLDEVNRAPDKDTLQTIFKLLLKKEIHERKLPSNWRVAAAMNPENDSKYYVQEMDLALKTRFIKYVMDCNAPDWIEWAYENKVFSAIIDFISVNPDALQSEEQNNPRTWTQLSKLCYVLEEDGLINEYMYDKAKGLLDPGSATAFNSFVMGNLERPVKAEEIFSDYLKKFEKKEKGPRDKILDQKKRKRIDLLNATVMEIIKTKVPKVAFANLRQFLLDLPPDMSYNMLTTMMNKDELHEEMFGMLTKDKDVEKLINEYDYDN